MHDTVGQYFAGQDHFLGESARITGGNTNKAQVIAQVVHPPLAIIASAAVNVGGDGQAVAGRIAFQVFADGFHHSGHLVPRRDAIHARWRAFFPTPQIGAAYPTRLNLKYQPITRRRRVWEFPYLKFTSSN